jgi:Flp pilus assembly protein TadB
MQMKFMLNSPAKSPGPLRKLAALIVTVAVAGLVLMFGAVLLLVLVILGAIAWAYLWWKTRELRKRMRAFSPQGMMREAEAGNGRVFEGEVVRVVEPRDGR